VVANGLQHVAQIRAVRKRSDGAAGATVTPRGAHIPVPKASFFAFARIGARRLIDGILGKVSFAAPWPDGPNGLPSLLRAPSQAAIADARRDIRLLSTPGVTLPYAAAIASSVLARGERGDQQSSHCPPSQH
jgi:hypothetical protein